MDVGAALGALGPIAAAVGLGFGFVQYSERRRQQLLTDLQGGKEAVAAAATRVSNGRLPHRIPRYSAKQRYQLFEALCLAAVFEGSGRSRSLIYSALAKNMESDQYRWEIAKIVDDISVTVGRNWAYTDLGRAHRRLYALRAALGLDGDVRLRLDRLSIAVGESGRYPISDRLWMHEAYAWLAMKNVVEKLGSVVMVCFEPATRSWAGAVISLGFHRAARPTGTNRSERFVLTRLGYLVILGKYGLSAIGEANSQARIIDMLVEQLAASAPARADIDVEQLAASGPARADINVEQLAAKVQTRAVDILVEQLAAAIKSHPRYDSALIIAAVPGREHAFSDRLGRDVAECTKKRFVAMELSKPKGSDLQFRVMENSLVDGRVILIDDVYRTGMTMSAAASALLDAGANEVLGLTATCTISAAVMSCGDDHGDRETIRDHGLLQAYAGLTELTKRMDP